MKVIIADYDEEAIRLFEEQCKQFSYVELSGFYKYRIKWYGRTSARRKVTGIKS